MCDVVVIETSNGDTAMSTSTETTGLRCARDFDLTHASAWQVAADTGRHIGYEDAELLDIIETFAKAIMLQSNVYLSRETEARIAAFMADGRFVAVRHDDHNG
jgi:hypothetical protein